MTSKIKCPFCQQELRQDYTGVMYCDNEDCEQSADWYGSQILWRALMQAKQDLEIAVDALKKIKEPTAWGSLYQEQEIATEALEIIGTTPFRLNRKTEHKE